MKHLLFFLAVLCSLSTFAQADITGPVSEAIKKGDAAGLSAYFMPQVDVSLPGASDTFTKDQARDLVAKFFAANPPKAFVIKHQGTSKLDDQYRIGELSTAKGSYRVTFFIRKNGNALLIKQLKIEQGE